MEKSEVAALFSCEAPKDSERAPVMLVKAKGASVTRTAALARSQDVAMLTSSRDSATRVSPQTPSLQLASLGPVPLPSETKHPSHRARIAARALRTAAIRSGRAAAGSSSCISKASRWRAERCLAKAIYFEARDQP